MRANVRTRWSLMCAAALLGALPACPSDYLLSARDLEVVPNPAASGDSVFFAFTLTIAPAQGYTVTALIDGAQHLQVTGSTSVEGPYLLPVGTGAELIARYGAGTHDAAIEVRLDQGARTASASRTFALNGP